MVDLIEYIDNQIKDCIQETKQFGLCHLIQSDNQKIPVTVESEATEACPEDLYLVTTYHRLLTGAYEVRDDLSFGKKMKGENKQRVRMVVFIQFSEGQSLIDDIFNAMPDTIILEGYENVFVSRTATLLRDRATLWSDEFGESYRDKYQMTHHIYAIEYDLNYIKCNVCV